jgi:Rap1a immunity proteins
MIFVTFPQLCRTAAPECRVQSHRQLWRTHLRLSKRPMQPVRCTIMILRLVRLCLFLMAATASPALSESRDAYLFRQCTSTAARAANPACTNYTYGILAEVPFNRSDAALKRHTCFPKTMNPMQAQAIVENYIRNHPERVGANAAIVRAEAFNSAFSCN